MKSLQFLAIALLAAASAEAARAELRVLRSSGPSAREYPTGRRLPDNHRFALRPRDTMLLLSTRGGRVILTGPGTGTTELLVRQGRGRYINKGHMGSTR